LIIFCKETEYDENVVQLQRYTIFSENWILKHITCCWWYWLTGGLLRAERLATYIVGFSEHHCAGAQRPELVLVSRDDSPVRVRVQLPWRHDVMRSQVAVLYKDRPRRIVLPAAVRTVVNNGTDNKGNEIASFCYRWSLQRFVF